MLSSSLVSVIVPCFNYGHLLPSALESVLSQTYESIEIILINDGSTDNTDQIANRYKDKYPKKIRYYKQENKGIIYTRNRGVSLAKGKYVIQLDADDWLDKDYIKETVSVADKTGVDIVYTDVKIVRDGLNIDKQFNEFNLDKLKYENYIHVSSLMNKHIFSNIQYDKNLEKLCAEDWDVFLGACLSGSLAKKAKNTFLFYRKHSNHNSRSSFVTHKQIFEARLYIFSKYLNIYPDQMGDLNILNKLFEMLKSENRKGEQQIKALEQKNLNKENEIKKLKEKIILLETEIKSVQSSRLRKVSRRLKNKINHKIHNENL